VTVDQVQSRLSANGKDVMVVDVREREEYREGHLPGAVSLPRGFLEMRGRPSRIATPRSSPTVRAETGR
jgi:rhodanese-related sulfurtransferase